MSTKNLQLRKANQLYVDLPVVTCPSDHRFYVLLHGLISLVDGPGDELRAYALTMDGDHHYRFGHWLVEDILPSGLRASLSGVKPSKKTRSNSLNPKLNPTIRLTSWPNDSDPRIRARVTLPRPRRIHYLGLGKAEIAHPELLLHPTSTASGLTVLEYKLPRCVDDLELRGDDGRLYWKGGSCTAVPSEVGLPIQVATLHIFDAPPQALPGTQHSLDEFALSTSLMGQPDVRFLSKPVDLPEQPTHPDGLSAFEIEPLAARPRFLHRLADFARTAHFSASQPLSDDGCKSCCSACDGEW